MKTISIDFCDTSSLYSNLVEGGAAPRRFISFPITLLQPLLGHFDNHKPNNSPDTCRLVSYTFFFNNFYVINARFLPWHLCKHWSNCEGHYHFGNRGTRQQEMKSTEWLFFFFCSEKTPYVDSVQFLNMLQTEYTSCSSKPWRQICGVHNYNSVRVMDAIERFRLVPGYQECF